MAQHQQPGIEPMMSAAATPATPEFVPVPPITAPAAMSAPIAEPSAPVIPAAVSAVDDNIDNELLEIFLEEAVDILGNVEHALSNWRASPEQNSNDIHELKRALHTLKGGSRMAGLMSIGELSHGMETALNAVEQGDLQADSNCFNLFDEVHDTLSAVIDQMNNHQPMSDISHLTARVTALVSGEPVPEVVVEETATFDTLPVFTAEPAFAAQPTERATADVPMSARSSFGSATSTTGAEEPTEKKERTEVTRVRTELLDNLVNFAGEVSISRSRMEQQIYSFRDNLKELHSNVERFRAQIRDLEIQSESQIMFRAGQEESAMGTDFDPLEFDRFSNMQHLSRGLNESLHDLSTIQSQLDNFVGEAETTLQQQARINTDLQEGLMRTRMVSFSTQSARLRHIVRQTARELGKNVELKLLGSEVEVDRNVLERMIGPFEHMIRNAIGHGMETEAERHQSGKPPVGTITIDTRQQGSEIIIRFSDDGKGLGIDIIRQKAIEKGLMNDGERLSDDAVIQYILVSGFSTASEITHLSGRGVGMDVVHNEVKQLGGAMAVDTEKGQGTSFVIRLPLTLSVTQALLVTAGEQLFAVPLSAVENIIEAEKEELNKLTLGKKPMFNYNDQVYPFVNMSLRMGLEPHPRSERKVAVLLVKTGTRNYAMEVDGLIGTKEVVVKAMSPLLSELSGFAGATIMGDGTVIPIIDPPGLLLSDKGMSVSHGMATMMRTADEKPKRERPLVMIVDDSLTVRKITSRHLERRGMDVITAKDGLDAVEQLREIIPDVMLVDIEMPRMDGYELTSRVRSESTLNHIPIIMITSRAGEKHRKRAFDLGVNEYMSKPYQEDELVTNIERVVGETVNA
ncbi:MAG TPA: hybrid sensor histidine kinase/response regulator [Acidiferrobacteraceae bacterium]|nr:hybrid sensor histidine kinase/response regulator [Acidiferrobacteraceae bacterium]HEX19624.1 hybrid sensor histidine kinase/response regulator [Acidiferrobacteraceae bacterium]